MTLLQTQTLEIQVYISRISNFYRSFISELTRLLFKDHNLKGSNFNTLSFTYSKAFMLESMKHANLPGVASLQPAQTKAQNRKSHATRFPLSTVGKTYDFQFIFIFLTLKDAGGGQSVPMGFQLAAISHRIMLWSQKFLTLSINIPIRRW